MRTAGRTVTFSSLTVAAALLALLVFPQRFLYSMASPVRSPRLMAMAVALDGAPGAAARARQARRRRGSRAGRHAASGTGSRGR